MPAVNEIDADNFHKIMNNRLFDFWLVRKILKLFLFINIFYLF
jgi:hypothetical protein